MKMKTVTISLTAAIMAVSASVFADNAGLIVPPSAADAAKAAAARDPQTGIANYNGFWYRFSMPVSNGACPKFMEQAAMLPANYLDFNAAGPDYGHVLDGSGDIENTSAGTVAMYGTGYLNGNAYDRHQMPNPDEKVKVCFKYVNSKASGAEMYESKAQ